MGVELRGFDDLENDLVNMANALDHGPVVDQALQAGAAPIEAQIKANASSDPKIITGDLYNSIHTGKVKGGKGRKYITTGVHYKERITQTPSSTGMADQRPPQRTRLCDRLLTPNKTTLMKA